MKTIWNEKGEGMLVNLIMLAFLAAGAYFAFIYFWPKAGVSDKPSSATATPSGGPIAVSPAGQQVQGAQAAGDLMGAGR